MSRDVFPSTQRTWIDEQVDLGPEGRRELNRHIMELYAHPLAVYLSGIPYVRGADHADLVRGFFADRLDRADFFDRWRASGRRLREWLRGALWFYLKEEHRRRRPHEALPDDAPGGKPARDADRAYLVSLVERACERRRGECERRGLCEHWEVFLRRDREGQGYAEIAAAFGIDERRAGVMARTARTRFEAAVRELLVGDGIPERDVATEVGRMLQELRA